MQVSQYHPSGLLWKWKIYAIKYFKGRYLLLERHSESPQLNLPRKRAPQRLDSKYAESPRGHMKYIEIYHPALCVRFCVSSLRTHNTFGSACVQYKRFTPATFYTRSLLTQEVCKSITFYSRNLFRRKPEVLTPKVAAHMNVITAKTSKKVFTPEAFYDRSL